MANCSLLDRDLRTILVRDRWSDLQKLSESGEGEQGSVERIFRFEIECEEGRLGVGKRLWKV